MRDAIAIGTLGLVMFVVAQVYGGHGQPEVIAVDLPAAIAYQPPRDSQGDVNPNYQDMAIAVLQHANRELNRTIREQRLHDSTVHRGTLVPLRYRCP